VNSGLASGGGVAAVAAAVSVDFDSSFAGPLLQENKMRPTDIKSRNDFRFICLLFKMIK
jgi:hypothetical protein